MAATCGWTFGGTAVTSIGYERSQELVGLEPDIILNLKTAKALGLTIPPNLLAIADEVIE